MRPNEKGPAQAPPKIGCHHSSRSVPSVRDGSDTTHHNGEVLRPRPYQTEAIEAVRQAKLCGVQRQLVVLPTGAGKTVVFSHLIRRRAASGRALIIAHRKELLEQAIDKLAIVAPGMRVGMVKAERDEHQDMDVVAASIQTIAQPKRMTALLDSGGFSTVIVDEAHHAVASTYLATLEALGSFTPGGPLTVGVTATAGGRSDNVGLGAAWDKIVYQRGILYMIANGYLADVKALEVQTDLDYGRLTTVGGDYTNASLGLQLDDSGAIEAAAHAYGKWARDRRGVAFTPTIDTAHSLAERLTALGIRAEALSGKTPPDERAAILGRVRDGSTQVVTNCQVLTEGFDEPALSCALIARPTRSQLLFTQMSGRVLRKHPGKDNALILALAAPPEAGLATIADLAGDAPGGRKIKPKPGETITEALEREEAEAAERDRRRFRSTVTAREVNLFAASRLRWLPVNNGFTLPARGTQLLLIPRGDRWDVVEAKRGEPPTIVTEGLTLDYAQGVGEEFARAASQGISGANARWLRQPVSDPQRQTLIRLGLPIPATRGEASDVIAVAQARRVIAQLAHADARSADAA